MFRRVIAFPLILALLAATPATARITRIVIATRETPTFGGYSWPGVGPYEKLAGKAYGEVDPLDPKNAVIVDLALAPGNARGRVDYSFDFYILKPVDLGKGAHLMMYEPTNRGRKTWNTFGRVPAGNDPGSTITDPAILAKAFLMPRGYTMVWSGWDRSAGTSNANFNSTITVPVARNPDGSSITGPSYEYIVSSEASYPLSYPAATLDRDKAKLTHRVHLNDKAVEIPASGWDYDAAGTSIRLAGGNFVANDIYEFSYIAKDPTVNGLGFAAVRDWNAWLRYETVDDEKNANPLAGDVRRIFTEVVSQPGRLLNDFRHLGFNQAENGKKVFDGLMQWIAAGDRRHLHRTQDHPLSLRLRSGLLRDRHRRHQPTRNHAAVRGQPEERPHLPEFRAEDRRRRQRHRGRAPSRRERAPRDLHGLGAARRSAGRRRL